MAFVLSFVTMGLTLPTYVKKQAGLHGWELPIEGLGEYVKVSLLSRLDCVGEGTGHPLDGG
jgi:hypothetical protein